MPSDPSPSPEVSEVMLSAFFREANALGYTPTTEDARRMLTAALRLDDPEPACAECQDTPGPYKVLTGADRCPRCGAAPPPTDDEEQQQLWCLKAAEDAMDRVGITHPETTAAREALERRLAALEAAQWVPPPASDPETLERAARAMYEVQRGALGIPATFEQIGEGGQEGWRKKAREALGLNTTTDEEGKPHGR